MEGITQEAASLAGHLRLGKLIYLYDNNHISLAGATGLIFTEDVRQAFRRLWLAHAARGGRQRYRRSRRRHWRSAGRDRRPSLILVRTHIGYGSPKKQDNFSAHGSPLGEDELQATKKALGWPTMDKFFIPPEDAVSVFRKAIDRGAEAQAGWQKRFAAYREEFPNEAAEFETMIAGKLPEDWAADLPKWKPTDKADRHARGRRAGSERAGASASPT